MVNTLPMLMCGLIWCLPFALALAPLTYISGTTGILRFLLLGSIPVLFTLAFLSLAGILSIPAQKKIIKGKFPREPLHPVYFWRRVYGLCWTSVYYFKPLYHVVLSVPLLKRYLLFLFGYRGATNFTVYPDTWIRDLPILKLGAGCYLSNRATMGTNMCLADGTVFVDHITVEEKAVVGHLSMIGPGSKLGPRCEVGVGAAIGIRSRLAEGSKVGICCMLSHGVLLGRNSQVGNHSYIGLRTTIADNVNLPAGSNLPAGASILTQEDVEKYFSSETQLLKAKKDEMSAMLMSFEPTANG